MYSPDFAGERCARGKYFTNRTYRNTKEGAQMLVLSRKDGESIRIGEDIEITVRRRGSQTKLEIDAPRHMRILRSELAEQDAGETVGAA